MRCTADASPTAQGIDEGSRSQIRVCKRWRSALCLIAWALLTPDWGTTVRQDARRGIVVMAIIDRSSSARRTRRMRKLATKLKEEFAALLPPTIFFFVALHIVALIR